MLNLDRMIREVLTEKARMNFSQPSFFFYKLKRKVTEYRKISKKHDRRYELLNQLFDTLSKLRALDCK